MNEKPLPGHEQQPGEIKCPSCGHFVGALTRCPHCGARVTKRITVRATRWAAVLLATIGLVLLYWMSVSKQIPEIRIGDIGPTMNFAYVQIKGTVTRDAGIFREGGKIRSLRFNVDDGTGEIPVTAYRDQAQELVESGRLPRLGDEVVVAGSLSVAADDRILMRLQVPEQLVVQSSDIPELKLGEIQDSDKGSSVMISGVISRISAPRPGEKRPWVVTVKDGTGRGEITFWDDVYSNLPNKERLVPGAPLKARVVLGDYRGQLQLSVAHETDLVLLAGGDKRDEAIPSRTPIKTVMLDEIGTDLAGQRVETEGQVVSVQRPGKGSKAPYRVILQDGKGRIEVVFWQEVAEQLGDQFPEKGMRLQVRGEVEQFKKKVQLKVSFSDQIQILTQPADHEEPFPESAIKAIKQIKKSMTGEVAVVSGKLGEPRSIRGGVVYPLKDKSGTISVVLWDKAVPGEFRDSMQAGKTATVSGPISVYDGKLQVVPRSPVNVRID